MNHTEPMSSELVANHSESLATELWGSARLKLGERLRLNRGLNCFRLDMSTACDWHRNNIATSTADRITNTNAPAPIAIASPKRPCAIATPVAAMIATTIPNRNKITSNAPIPRYGHGNYALCDSAIRCFAQGTASARGHPRTRKLCRDGDDAGGHHAERLGEPPEQLQEPSPSNAGNS